jgi:hypothetical protein
MSDFGSALIRINPRESEISPRDIGGAEGISLPMGSLAALTAIKAAMGV